jgi:alpha-L-fucosidase
MYDTALSDFSATRSPCGRDLLGETADAVRGEGLRVGIYFSLSDWHHPDYPAFTEADKPYVFGASPPIPPGDRWARYLDFMFGQMRELLSGYGPVDVVWFDGGWERPAAMWKPKELEALVRSLQPDVLINDRLPGVGDFATPEQFVPSTPPEGRWETCLTMNESWGYNPEDCSYKSGRQLVHAISEIAGKGGNLLLNVSPTGTGAIPPEQLDRLEQVATWMAGHAEAVKATRPGLAPWQFYGPTTRRAETVYLHMLMRPYETFTVRGVPIRRVRSVRELSTGTELEHGARSGIIDSLTVDPSGELTVSFPSELVDPLATVVAVHIDDR